MKQGRWILWGSPFCSGHDGADLILFPKHLAIIDKACRIDRVIPQLDQQLIPAAQIDSINTLFSSNNLSVDNLQFNGYLQNDIQVPGVHRQMVTANLFFHGLPLFDFHDAFTFDDGVLINILQYPGFPSSNDTSGHQTLSFLRSSFIKYAMPSSPDNYANTCLSATLGYLDIGYIPKNTLPFGTPIKVWQITPSNATYPIVYVKDDDSTAWNMPTNRVGP